MRRGDVKMKDDPDRVSPDPENLVVLAHYHPLMAEAAAKFPSTDWTRVAAEAGVPLQPVRTPEEALADESLISEGAIVTVAAPGARGVAAGRHPLRPRPHARPHPGAGAAGRRAQRRGTPGGGDGCARSGRERRGSRFRTARSVRVVVLDLGFAVAGPYATQLLGRPRGDRHQGERHP